MYSQKNKSRRQYCIGSNLAPCGIFFKVAHLVKNFDKIAHTKKVFEKIRIILIKTRLVIVILIKKDTIRNIELD
jgi:hypothetical protein